MVPERVVVRGRLFADGMWLTHLLWGLLTLPFMVVGLWASWMSTTGTKAAGGLAFLGVLFMLTALIIAAVWRLASYAIVLRPDGLWCRPGFIKSVFIPYADMVFLGATKRGFVLAYEKQQLSRRISTKLALPPWALSSRLLREEIQLRAPHIQMTGETEIRLWAFKSRLGSIVAFWTIMAAPLVFLALMWRPQGSPVSKETLISAGVVWIVVLVALFVWQVIGERRITG